MQAGIFATNTTRRTPHPPSTIVKKLISLTIIINILVVIIIPDAII
jgi:hypothetical protein